MSQLVRVRLSHGLLEKVPLCAPRKRIWEVRRKSVELTIDGGQTDRRPPPTEWVKAGATTRATVCLPAMAADLTPCVFCGTPRPLDVPRCPTCKRGWIDSHVVTSTTRPSSGQDPEPAPASPTPTGTDDSADAPVAATAVPVATAAASTVPEAPAEPSPAEHEDEDEDDPPAGQGEPAMDADAAEVEAPPAVAAAGCNRRDRPRGSRRAFACRARRRGRGRPPGRPRRTGDGRRCRRSGGTTGGGCRSCNRRDRPRGSRRASVCRARRRGRGRPPGRPRRTGDGRRCHGSATIAVVGCCCGCCCCCGGGDPTLVTPRRRRPAERPTRRPAPQRPAGERAAGLPDPTRPSDRRRLASPRRRRR